MEVVEADADAACLDVGDDDPGLIRLERVDIGLTFLRGLTSDDGRDLADVFGEGGSNGVDAVLEVDEDGDAEALLDGVLDLVDDHGDLGCLGDLTCAEQEGQRRLGVGELLLVHAVDGFLGEAIGFVDFGGLAVEFQELDGDLGLGEGIAQVDDLDAGTDGQGLTLEDGVVNATQDADVARPFETAELTALTAVGLGPAPVLGWVLEEAQEESQRLHLERVGGGGGGEGDGGDALASRGDQELGVEGGLGLATVHLVEDQDAGAGGRQVELERGMVPVVGRLGGEGRGAAAQELVVDGVDLEAEVPGGLLPRGDDRLGADDQGLASELAAGGQGGVGLAGADVAGVQGDVVSL